MPSLSPHDIRTGQFLVEHNLISSHQLDYAISLSERYDSPLIDVLMTLNWVRPLDYYRQVAKRFRMPLVDLTQEQPDPTLLSKDDVAECARFLTIPIRREGSQIILATAHPGPAALLFARRRWGQQVQFVITAKFDILWALQRLFSEEHSDAAVSELADQDPTMSARTVITRGQKLALGMTGLLLLAGAITLPSFTATALFAVFSVFYVANFLFKTVLVWFGSRHVQTSRAWLADEVAALRDEDLPVFTVLVPMFREPEVLPILAKALRDLDYPLPKLDIKIVLEEGDDETINAAKQLGLEGIFEIIRVPASLPQTKPKACNYALRYARGDFLVIYDAEDKPEPDQLRKVVAAFRHYPPETACIQCRLNYYNAEENWLTRMFTLDYSLWFDLMLPGLQRLGIPIPLGGTSNHFRIEVLRELHAWDPFNVTEDADLGIRLTQKGYKVGLVESTTYEEANVSQYNWIRQRSRWIKGYIQTFLVHTRRPLNLVRQVGPLGTIGLVSFIGGTMVSGLINPLFWVTSLVWICSQGTVFQGIIPEPLARVSLISLVVGNGLLIHQLMLAPVARRQLNLVPYALTVFWYWVLMSIAAWKGLVQLVTKPFYWEKTQHGLSRFTAGEVAAALAQEPVT